MKNCYVVRTTETGAEHVSAHLFSNPLDLKVIDHPVRMRIIKALAQNPQYPAELAGTLELPEQNVYYHVKKLHDAGILTVVEKNEIRGTVAKKFAPTSTSFAVTLTEGWISSDFLTEAKQNNTVSTFFRPLISDKRLHGCLVVGAPDPHGPLQASARDGHYATDVGLFLGQYVQFPSSFSVKLDIDVKLEKQEATNMVLIGGPVTNMMVADVNAKLGVSFSEEQPYGLHSKRSGRNYTEDAVGLIARVPNPYDPKKVIILLAGIRAIGTKSAVIALTRHQNRIFRDFDGRDEWYRVVKGVDLDGDGKIDFIEILE